MNRTCVLIMVAALSAGNTYCAEVAEIPDEVRAQQVMDMKWGMFICWSFSTFSGQEWTKTLDKDAGYFRATGCDTDQWCRTAKEAGMGYILFLSKHHDGFCLWDTATTEKKVTRSPLGVDVLAKLRKSCDEHGIKLALYFSEGDWNWPGARDGGSQGGGSNPEAKKAQLAELCTRYGPIEFFWMDHAVGDGGLNHEETVKWVHRFQPDCLVGFNHGAPAGRLALRERGRPGPIGGENLRKHGKGMENDYSGYLVAEFTYPILPPHQGGAQWFYSLPEHDNLCFPAERLYRDYLGALKHGNIFSIDVGPNHEGKLRDVDVKTLREVGEYIRGERQLPPPPISQGKPARASGEWDASHSAAMAVDGDPNTRWGAEKGSRQGWLEVDLGGPVSVWRVVVDESDWNRVNKYVVQAHHDGAWKTILDGTTLGGRKELSFDPVTADKVRLKIIEATEVPTIHEFEVHAR